MWIRVSECGHLLISYFHVTDIKFWEVAAGVAFKLTELLGDELEQPSGFGCYHVRSVSLSIS